MPAAHSQAYEKIFSFSDARAKDTGVLQSQPRAGLVLGSDGNFYGTTSTGGLDVTPTFSGYGTVFKMTPSGVITVLANFTGTGGTTRGRSPEARLVQGSDGNFYGTTSAGGTNNFGTVFKITPGGMLTTLVEFTNTGASNKGALPSADLVQGSDGNFYGTTSRGGLGYNPSINQFGYGTVFKMTPGGVLTTLVEFTGNGASNIGSNPSAGLIQGADGNFYGTTQNGGTFGNGTLFKMTSAGVVTTLVNFTGDGGLNRGAYPLAGLVQGSTGHFYGTTSFGGASGKGTVFKMATDGTVLGTTLETLVDFTGTDGSKKGFLTATGLVQGSDGSFYGTTQAGGTNDFGTVFKISLTGEFATLVEFTDIGGSNRGSGSVGDLVQGNDGSLYGMTSSGGAFDSGTVFKMTPAGALTTLVDFKAIAASTIGSVPFAGLTQGSDGIFYGTTRDGGANNLGTVFKMTQDGELTTLVGFTGTGGINKGSAPQERLIQAVDGNFYGITNGGGANNLGTVFKMTPAGTLTTLVEFPGSGIANTGNNPLAGLVQGSDGHFYGTTFSGGAAFNGTVFKIVTDGTFLGTTLTTLVNFTGMTESNKGRSPHSGLVQGSNGFFYGTTTMGGGPNRGTVFRMTATGTMTTLVEFTGNGLSNKGESPNAGLVLGNDGNFYGSTAGGGPNNFGTLFRMTPEGVLTTLVEFTGTMGSYIGRSPHGDLVQGSDGTFYGTTLLGGGTNNGTIFKMTTNGTFAGTTLTTLVEFPSSTDGAPYATLISALDGNFYGTTTGGDGAIYRLILPGPPLVNSINASASSVDALLTAKFNARGANTAVQLEWGTDMANLATIVPITVNLNNYQTVVLGSQLSGLIPGTTYFYQFRAVSSAGTTLSQVRSFNTLAQPLVVIGAASDILPTSAQFNGTVNAQNFGTTVLFEWGLDGNSFPNQIPAFPGMVTGNNPVLVSTPVAGLTAGLTYYYRIVASNAGGTVVSGTQAFTTLTEPIAITGAANALSTTRAEVRGTVNTLDSSASVSFEYGTDGINFPNSFSATPASVSGNIPVAVTATLTGLQQGTTYHYRIRATGPGGTGLGTTRTFSLSILSGLVQVFPDPPPSANGTVTVNFDPTTQGAWRFAGENAWRNSGVAATSLASGPRLIEFLPLAGYISPLTETLDVVSGANIVLDRIYFETGTAGNGNLTVRLKPEGLGGQWRFVGESPWRDSGTLVSALAAGSYLVECKPVTGKVTPPTASVSIVESDSRELTLTYFTANSTGAATPLPLPFSSVSVDEDLPYAYLGQIRTAVGSSSGFVVKRRVVATAGHVVFDDGSLSYISGMQWLFQRHSGLYEPTPQIPRGNYLATGYATQRQNDNTPGQGSAESQALDYAALYFLDEAGRGGYGGFLATDAGDDNEFLTSDAQKILAGFPVDGIPTADEGKLHATAAFNVELLPALGETWTSTDLRGYGGMSGGPLFVQQPSGLYLPAAIYLGGNGQTVVRAIDSSVVDLFLRAEVSGNGGDNNTGGGITHTSVTNISDNSNPGAIKVTIRPAAAANAGRWGLKPESSNRSSGTISSGRAAGDYILRLTTISGFQTPASETVRINGGQLKEITYTYEAEQSPPVITSASSTSGTRGQSLTYQIVASQSPSSYSLSGSLPSGLTFNTNNGQLTGTLQQAGVFSVILGASNSGGTGTKTLVLTSRPSVSNQSASAALGQPMSQQITSSESGADLNYTASDLPPGTSLNETTGLITGSPSQAGVFNSLFTVTKDGANASAILTLTVTATPVALWRQANFQTTSNIGDAADNADPDKDGQTNLSEYAAGTNPNSATDFFKILTTTKNPTAFTVTAAGKAARSYFLERRANLATSPWTTVTSLGPLSIDAPITLTDPNSPPSAAFYRLRVSAP